MTKSEINASLQEILSQEGSFASFKEGNELVSKYQREVAHELKQQREKLIADGGDPQSFVPVHDEEDEQFDHLRAELIKKEREWKATQEESKKANESLRDEIIREIKNITENEENIGAAFKRINELHDSWKQIKTSASEDIKKFQAEYTKARDEFYYNIRIHKELLEHDLKRNLQLKEELLEKIEGLKELVDSREIELRLKAYLQEWDDIGPTFKDKWEEVKERFKNAQKEAFSKVRGFYKDREQQQQQNLEKKKELIEKLSQIVDQEIVTEKRWKKLTSEVINLQRDWKKIGFAPKEYNQSIWEEFKALGDDFFGRKSKFYEGLKQEHDRNRDLKQDLVEKAEALQHSDDWKGTTAKLVAYQKEWQKIGNASQREEQRLWRKFRGACNHFFEAKKNHFKNLTKDQDENLKLKLEVVQRIESFEPSGDKDKDLEALRELSGEYGSIGFVPIEKKNEVQHAFDEALKSQYAKLGLKDKEQRKVAFENKLEEIANADNADDLIYREEKVLQDKIKKIENTIIQYENNLGFFSNSSGAESMIADVEAKIEANKKELENLKNKLSALRNI